MRATVAQLRRCTPFFAAARAVVGTVALALAACQAASGTRSMPRLDPTAAIAPKVTDAQCPVGRRVVWHGSFDSQNWLASWDPRAAFDYGERNTEVVSDSQFVRVLRVHYPAGSSSSSYAREGHPIGGAEFKVSLPKTGSASSIFLSYWLRFDSSFQWVLGGKLPGVCGGRCPTGGALVTGEGGWSVRTMWRPSGAGELYAYILPARAWGTELGLGAWTFATGQWHRMAEELILNTDGQDNGRSRVWYDAEPTSAPTFEATNLAFRRDSTGPTTLLFSTFFGGHDVSWATPVDTFIDFARFVVCQ